jgi:glycosyltransferase involved in cell wall biosynthesis
MARGQYPDRKRMSIIIKDKKLRFLIVGDGPLKKNLMDRVLESGFQEEFIFTGMVDYNEIPLFINLADICVAPFISKRNDKTGVSPLKVYEYMACGKPVVASRVEGLDFLEEEGAGRLVEPEDVNDLEKALGDLLQDPGKGLQWGLLA